MSGAGPETLDSILQQIAAIVSFLPDVLLYAIAALLITLATIAFFAPSRTSNPQPATTASRPSSSGSTTSSNSHNQSSSGTDSTEETVTREQSSDTSPEDTASSSSSKTEPQHQSKPVSSPGRLGINTAVNEQPKRETIALEKAHTPQRNSTTSPHLWRQHRSTRNRFDSPTLATRLRNHVIDPVQIETGIDPIGWDSSWGLIKADFSLTGVSADTGGELVYFNAFPSPVSYKTSTSPIEVTTTSLIRRLLGTAASSSSPDQQSTARHSAASSQRQRRATRSDQNNAERQTRTHLYERTLEDISQDNSPSFTEASADPEPQSAPSIQDSSSNFSTRAETQNSHPPDTSGEHSHIGATRRKQTETPATDESMTAAEPFGSPGFSMTETSDTNPPLGIPTEHQVFEPLRDTEPTPATSETTVQNDQQTARRAEPPVDHPMQSEIHPQFGLPSLTKSDECLPGEATLNAALPGDEPRDLVEDLTHGLDAIGIDSTHFGFDGPDDPQNSWPEAEPLEPVSDSFGVSDAADRFNDTELFPDVTFDDPLTEAHDDLEDFHESLFDTGIRF